jgi:hypothetical protein
LFTAIGIGGGQRLKSSSTKEGFVVNPVLEEILIEEDRAK